MATHALPDSSTKFNIDEGANLQKGWIVSLVRTALQKGGSAYEKFSTNFTNDVRKVEKEYSFYGSTLVPVCDGTKTKDAFWVLSYRELTGSNKISDKQYFDGIAENEGTKYANVSDKIKSERLGNDDASWWLRNLGSTIANYYVKGSTYNNKTQWNKGIASIVPAFCF